MQGYISIAHTLTMIDIRHNVSKYLVPHHCFMFESYLYRWFESSSIKYNLRKSGSDKTDRMLALDGIKAALREFK